MEIAGRISRARTLRRDQTDAERALWAKLRNRQLAGCKFRRQLPIGRYIADFACVEAKLVIELDGGQHAERQDYDEARTEVLEAAGWRVLRFWNPEVMRELEGVVATILTALQLARP